MAPSNPSTRRVAARFWGSGENPLEGDVFDPLETRKNLYCSRWIAMSRIRQLEKLRPAANGLQPVSRQRTFPKALPMMGRAADQSGRSMHFDRSITTGAPTRLAAFGTLKANHG